MICARAPSATDTARLRTSPWAPAGASLRTSAMEPGGARSSMGRKAPWFTAPPGSSVDFTATNTPAPVTASEEFTTPGTCGLEPAKSAMMRSPATVSLTRISTGSSAPSS